MFGRLRIFFSALVLCSFPLLAPSLSHAQRAEEAATGFPQMAAPAHSLGPNFFGVNIENSYFNIPVPSWTDPAWLDAIRRVGIEAVRYPGGDAGNYWDWQTGTVYPRGSASSTSDSLADLAFLAKNTGAVPLYNLNVLTFDNALVDSSTLSSAIENQLKMLSSAHELGLPIANIELGNEFFWTGADHDAVFPTAADYASTMKLWTAKLHQEYPTAAVAAVASIPYATDDRTKTWNTAVLGKVLDARAVTLHRYEGIVDGGMYDGTTPEGVLSYAFTDWADIVKGEIEPIERHSLRAWITEFGGFSDCTSDAHLTGTWLEGLYQSQMAIQFLSTPTVDQIDLYNISGSTSSLVFQDSSSYWDSCLSKSISFRGAPGELTATGQAYSLIGNALKQANSVYPVRFPQAPLISPGAPATAYPSLTGVALTGKLNQWLLLNLGEKPLTLSYPAMGEGQIESVSAPALTTLVTSERELTHTARPFDGERFTLAPYSVNSITIESR
jgi:hypothetical protein